MIITWFEEDQSFEKSVLGVIEPEEVEPGHQFAQLLQVPQRSFTTAIPLPLTP